MIFFLFQSFYFCVCGVSDIVFSSFKYAPILSILFVSCFTFALYLSYCLNDYKQSVLWALSWAYLSFKSNRTKRRESIICSDIFFLLQHLYLTGMCKNYYLKINKCDERVLYVKVFFSRFGSFCSGGGILTIPQFSMHVLNFLWSVLSFALICLSLSLICQMTSEGIKQHYLPYFNNPTI